MFLGSQGRLECSRGRLGVPGRLWGYLGYASDRAGEPMPGMNLLTAHGQCQHVQGDPQEAGGSPQIPGNPKC